MVQEHDRDRTDRTPMTNPITNPLPRSANPEIDPPAQNLSRVSVGRYSGPYPDHDLRRSRGNGLADAATGLAFVLSIIAFFFSSYAVIQAVNARRQVDGVREPASGLFTNPGTGGGSNPRNVSRPQPPDAPTSRPAFPFIGAPQPVTQSGQQVQPAFGGVGEVELLSVKRRSGAEPSNLVDVQLQVRRLPGTQGTETPTGNIALGDAIAINSRTNMNYGAAEFRTLNDEPISLYRLRPGDTTTATVTLRVPPNLDRIDIQIPQTRTFRNVAIVPPPA